MGAKKKLRVSVTAVCILFVLTSLLIYSLFSTRSNNASDSAPISPHRLSLTSDDGHLEEDDRASSLRKKEVIKINQDVIAKLGSRFPGLTSLVVVFSDREYLDFTLNSHASFQKNAPDDTPYIVVGMDKETVDECAKRNILSFLYSDLTKQIAIKENTSLEDVATRCIRMEVVNILQEAGLGVLLMDSDIAVTEPFDLLAYFSQLDVDIASGHGTFPQAMFEMNEFTLQSGFYFVKANEASKTLMKESIALCYEGGNGQVALNTYIMENFKKPRKTSRSVDSFGSRIFHAEAKDVNGGDLSIAVVGRKFFPTGCKFVEDANPHASIRHPGCLLFPQRMSLIQKKLEKKASLQDQGAWFLESPPKKAIFWSFPGSGNTILRYTFEQLTGKIGSTNSINYDRRLSPVLPGEGRFNGEIVKVHPLATERAMTESQRKEIFEVIPKRVVLVRNPFESIWSWYQLSQTTSHTKHIKAEDFNPTHFAMQAVKWANLYQNVVENEFVPFARDHPERTLLIKFDDLIHHQNATLRALLDFLEEETAGPSNDLHLFDHPLIHRETISSDHVSMITAYAATKGLVDEIWSVVKNAASIYSFSKPIIAESTTSSTVPSSLNLSKLRSHRYLTYSPTGGLTNQLMQLETAIQFAQASARTLLLPPLLASHTGVLKEEWTDPSANRICTPSMAFASHNGTLAGVETYQWNRVIDLNYLSSRVEVVGKIPDDIAALASRLSLFEYHKCNTKWLLDETVHDGLGCLPGYIQELRSPPEISEMTVRSTKCLFESSEQITVLQMGALFGTNPKGMLLPDVKFTEAAISAANAVSLDIRSQRSQADQYACAQMRVAGGVWESQSPFVADRERNLQDARNFLTKEVQDADIPVYISTDNEDLMRETKEICDQRRCLFASDFGNVTQSFGLHHFLELSAFDYLVCSQADYLYTSPRSSFGALIRLIHVQKKKIGYKMEPNNFAISLHSDRIETDVKDKKYAFVTLLGMNPNYEQYRTYVAATRALIQSLRESGTSADIVVMTLYIDDSTKKLLTRDGATVVEIEPLIPSPETEFFSNWFANVALAKVRAFELTQYERFQFLDSDVVLLKNFTLDHLFDAFPQSGMVSEGLGQESPIRSGWFMARPTTATFESLKGIAQRGTFSMTRGWDNLGLSASYPEWNPRGGMPKDPWGFYGAQLEQGLFFHEFYAMPMIRSASLDDATLLKLLDDDAMYSNGLVHCYGNLKPWNEKLVHLKDKSERIVEAHLRWNDLVSSLEWTDTQYLVSTTYESPLTEFGRRTLQVTYCDSCHGHLVRMYKVSFGKCHEFCVFKFLVHFYEFKGWTVGCCSPPA